MLSRLLNAPIPFWRTAFTLWTLFALLILFAPPSEIPDLPPSFEIPHLDKGIHALLFFVHTYLFLKMGGVARRRIIVALLLFLFWAFASEWIQENFTERTGDVWDSVADMSGSLMAILAFQWEYKRLRT